MTSNWNGSPGSKAAYNRYYEKNKKRINEKSRKLREDVTAWTREHKVELGCADCGYNEHHAALEFDHIEPHLIGPVSKVIPRGWKATKAEIERCEVVCANCHGIRTFNRSRTPDPMLLTTDDYFDF